jgi:hypothetical protein
MARHRWLTSIILATQEAEIKRMVVQSQPNISPPKKNHHKKGLVDWLASVRL